MTTPTRSAFVLGPGEGRAIDLGNFAMVVKANGEATGGALLRHGFRVGRVASRKLNWYTPAAMVGCFDELSAAIAGDEGDPVRLDEIARRHAMDVTGAVPDGYL